MLLIAVQAIWYFLPALTANMAPVFAARGQWLKRLNKPIDGGLMWRQRPLLGRNKTWRGLLVGVLAGALTSGLQFILSAPAVSLMPLPSLSGSLAWGALLGLSALAGDAVESFFKRRINKPPGETWLFWDQSDFIIGAVLISQIFFPISFMHILTAIVVTSIGALLVNYIGVKTKIKKSF